MKCSFRTLISFFLIALACCGCNVSVQSSQYSLVKSLLKPGSPAARENWQVIWNGRVYLVYAINHVNGIYFANESGLLVRFVDSQVTSFSLPNPPSEKPIEIRPVLRKNGGVTLRFQRGEGSSFDDHLCSAWQPVALQGGAKGWDQQCMAGSSEYTNEIRTNERNEVVSLKHVLVPGLAPIRIAQR